MRVTMWIMFIVGLVERTAKKFHGDFPAFASNRAWINKIVVSIALCALALFAAFSICQDYEYDRPHFEAARNDWLKYNVYPHSVETAGARYFNAPQHLYGRGLPYSVCAWR